MPCGPLKQPFRRKRSGRATAEVASRREERRTFRCIEGDCEVLCECWVAQWINLGYGKVMLS